MNHNVNKHLSLLGQVTKDKITGRRGVVTSVSFDLFGCIQAAINPGLDKDGKQLEMHWYDVARLKVVAEPVMAAPDFDHGAFAEGLHGPAEKPASRS